MKLPSDPAQLKKFAVALLLGVGVIVYVLKIGVLNPLNSRITRLKADLESAEKLQNTTRQYLQNLAPRRQSQREAISRLAQQLESLDFVLIPSLGNYDLPAQQRLQSWVRAADIFDPPQFRGRNIQTVRWPSERKEPPLLAGYPMSVSFRADLESTLLFLHIVERENPACGITSLTIAALPNSPQTHQITMDIEWPVWASETARATVTGTLSNALNSLLVERP